jgi:uncharacterized membrane protein
MVFTITIGVIAIVITCFSIEVKLRKTSEQNKEIIELLKQLKEK